MTRNKKLVRLMAVTIAAATVASSMPVHAAFDAEYYAKKYPQVVAVVGSSKKALENHYNTYGVKEGRIASAQDEYILALAEMFDAEYYAKNNPDVVKVYGNDVAALFAHFLRSGMKEGRNINPYFDINAYKKAYPDLVKAFGDNYAAYYIHFATYGQTEHRVLGGFPSEKILPGGVKAGAVSSRSSSGGSSVSSGSSSTDDDFLTVDDIVAEVSQNASQLKSDAENLKTSAASLQTSLEALSSTDEGAEGNYIAQALDARENGDEDAAVEAATQAKAVLDQIITDATQLKSDADSKFAAAQSAADEAQAILDAAAHGAGKTSEQLVAEIEQAQRDIEGAEAALKQAEEFLYTVYAVKVGENYYKSSAISGGALNDTATDADIVEASACLAGLQELIEGQQGVIEEKQGLADAMMEPGAEHESTIQAYLDAKNALNDAEQDATELTALKQAAVDAYNTAKETELTIDDWDTIIADEFYTNYEGAGAITAKQATVDAYNFEALNQAVTSAEEADSEAIAEYMGYLEAVTEASDTKAALIETKDQMSTEAANAESAADSLPDQINDYYTDRTNAIMAKGFVDNPSLQESAEEALAAANAAKSDAQDASNAAQQTINTATGSLGDMEEIIGEPEP
ncbi:MAG: hypothetical protein IKP29_10500 [Pseudobutyrivibrio sp.]|nr:hypothetical protein [Pseudobutyrivibrio sp.]